MSWKINHCGVRYVRVYILVPRPSPPKNDLSRASCEKRGVGKKITNEGEIGVRKIGRYRDECNAMQMQMLYSVQCIAKKGISITTPEFIIASFAVLLLKKNDFQVVR